MNMEYPIWELLLLRERERETFVNIAAHKTEDVIVCAAQHSIVNLG